MFRFAVAETVGTWYSIVSSVIVLLAVRPLESVMVTTAVFCSDELMTIFETVAVDPDTVILYSLPTLTFTDEMVAEFLTDNPEAVNLTVDLPWTIFWLLPVMAVTVELVS